MNLEQFTEEIRKRVQKGIKGAGSRVERTRIEKNNQVVRFGIGIRKEGGQVRTVTSIEAYYNQYQCGNIGIEEAAEDICKVLESDTGSLKDWNREAADYGKVRDKVMYRLVSRKWNEALLEEIPHIPFLDMEVIFWVMLGTNEWGQTGMLVHREICEGWPVDGQGLFAQAKENMMRMCPPEIKSMEEVMLGMIKNHLAEEEEILLSPDFFDKREGAVPLYVFSNRQGIYGAGAVLYPGVLKEFADSQGSDLVILPSSIHEVLLVPYEERLDFEYLRQMVRNINGLEVPPEDQLSDEVYLYERGRDAIRIAG